jgi:hypothetical protein
VIDDPLLSRAMEALLAGDHPVLGKLRTQLPHASASIKRTTIGLFADFAVPGALRVSGLGHLELGDVHLYLHGRDAPTHCVLHVDDGALGSIECYDMADQDWPEFPQVERIQYVSQKPRAATIGNWRTQEIDSRDLAGLELPDSAA